MHVLKIVPGLHISQCPACEDGSLQVIEGKGILWEGQLPSSLGTLTCNGLEQALQSQLPVKAGGAGKTGMNIWRASQSAFVSLLVNFSLGWRTAFGRGCVADSPCPVCHKPW